MKRRVQKSEKRSSGGASWLTTFNDLMTLLMVFFVLLFSMSSIDSRKIKNFQTALQSGLGMLLPGKDVDVGVIEPMVRNWERSNVTGEIIDDEPLEIDAEDLLARDLHQWVKAAEPENQEQTDQAHRLDLGVGATGQERNSVDSLLEALGSEPDIKVIVSKTTLRITLDDRVLFGLGEAEINPEGLPALEKIVRVLEKTETPVRVEGHTDNLPIGTDRFPSNWELSVARAVTVVKYFVDQGSLEPKRFSAVGYGDSRPLHPNDSPEGRAKNRRVEFVIVNQQGK